MSKEHSGSRPGRTKGRREFLRNMMLGGGAVAVGLITARETVTPPQPETAAAQLPESKGYRVTSHIEHYYRTAGL